MSEWALKRFWDKAEAGPAGDGWTVLLDGRPLRTPAKAPLIVPSEALAQALAAEWNAVDGEVKPAGMPHTRMANAAIDKVARQRREVANMLADYAGTDLVCYRADAPGELVARQKAAWDPLLDWAEAQFGARLAPVTGVMHAPQEESALARLAAALEPLSDFELAALHDLVTLPGSLIIGLAAFRGTWPLDELWARANLDELWQEAQWGADEEAAALRARKQGEFETAGRFLDFLNLP